MKQAYSGRAAARYVMGDYENSILDYDQAVLLHLETVYADPASPEAKVDCAHEYRKRSLAQRAAHYFKMGHADEEKAQKLEEEALALAITQPSSALKLQEEIDRLNQVVQKLQNRHERINYSAYRVGRSGVATSRLWLVNATNQSQSMYINDRPYVLSAGEEIPLVLPEGAFSYQLLWEGKLLPEKRSRLAAMQCFSLVISPR